MSTMESFKSFFASYAGAMAAGDEGALRETLPAEIDAGHLEFLKQMNQGFFAQVAVEGVAPEFRQEGDCFIARYQIEDEDGEETMDREFWWHDGRWVSYNPSEGGM